MRNVWRDWAMDVEKGNPMNEEHALLTRTTDENAALGSKPIRFGLEIQDQSGVRCIPVFEGGVVLGACRGVDAIVADAAVSRRHCEFVLDGGALRVTDLGSRNGTYIGAARVTQAWATPGTVVSIGSSAVTCIELRGDQDEVVDDPSSVVLLPSMAGGSLAMRRIAAQVTRLASMAAPVLISGETGTGKELVARALHDLGARAGKSFVALNVANLPRDLVESELFGHERGAFTGAVARRSGAFEEAAGGTLFLDEIGELPLDAQPKLLRALDGYDVRKVGGGGAASRPDARVVAATHVALEDRVEKGQFRRDLFHRLEVFVVTLPALRDRRSDIVPMAKAFLKTAAKDLGARTLAPQAAARLLTHDWPGNARELRNVLYRAADVARGSMVLEAAHIEAAMHRAQPKTLELNARQAKVLLASYNQNVSEAARAAGYPRTTFRKLLEQAS